MVFRLVALLASLPFFRYRIAEGTLAVTPTIYTNQGLGVALDWRQAVGDLNYSVRASGVYQLNPDAYTGLANRDFRGAIQTAGTFTATEEWTLGWSYTAFTDPAYLPDYRFAGSSTTNQVSAQYLDTDTYANIRVQQHVPLDNFSSWTAFENAQDQQALTHPNAVFNQTIDLAEDAGRVELTGRLLGLSRASDDTGSGYVFGYKGQSVHAMMQASWTNQYIVPGGVAAGRRREL